MKIDTLEWDSSFFGYKVGKLEVGEGEVISTEELLNSDYKLVYLMSNEQLTPLQLGDANALLVDVKLLLGKPAQKTNEHDKAIVSLNHLTDELVNLAIQSGVYSRYKLDGNFRNNEFERMYTTWITSSVEREDTAVYGFLHQDKLAGFITLAIKNNAADIGLIAVNEAQRGLNIGTKLLAMAEVYATQNQLSNITVNTQLANKSALNFYIKNGYKELKRTYIYHLWK